MAARDGKTIRASDWAEAGRKIRNDEGSILHGVIAEVHSLDHLHGAKQPGRLQRGVRLIELRRSEGVGLVALGWRSPMMRFAQPFVTFISRELAPGRSAEVASTR